MADHYPCHRHRPGWRVTTAVDVIFDSSKVPQPGTYTGYLLVETDTPVYTPITVPVTMTATLPVGWSKLMGTVQDLGYCDASPAPLEDAMIYIEGTVASPLRLRLPRMARTSTGCRPPAPRWR